MTELLGFLFNLSTADYNAKDYPMGSSPYSARSGYGWSNPGPTAYDGLYGAYPGYGTPPNYAGAAAGGGRHAGAAGAAAGGSSWDGQAPAAGTGSDPMLDFAQGMAYHAAGATRAHGAPSPSQPISPGLLWTLLLVFFLVLFVLFSMMRTANVQRNEVVQRMHQCPTHQDTANMIEDALRQHNLVSEASPASARSRSPAGQAAFSSVPAPTPPQQPHATDPWSASDYRASAISPPYVHSTSSYTQQQTSSMYAGPSAPAARNYFAPAYGQPAYPPYGASSSPPPTYKPAAP